MQTYDGAPVDCHVVFGQVVGVHIDDRFIVDGLLDTAAMRPIARCGYDQYATVDSVFCNAAAHKIANQIAFAALSCARRLTIT